MVEFKIKMLRNTRIRLNEKKTREQVNVISNLMAKQFPKWTVETQYDHEPSGSDGYFTYEADLLFSKDSNEDEEFVKKIRSLAISQLEIIAPKQFWLSGELNEDDEEIFDFEDWQIPELTDEVKEIYFGHIFERDAHIRIIYDALKQAALTNFESRTHILLKGKPACAKTILFLSFMHWLGKKLFLQLSAPTMTKAGLEKELLQRAQERKLPPIILCEEIEKTDGGNLNALLQVMDTRGEIQKTNFFIGNQTADARVILLATCNDEAKLRSFADGALYSRFSLKLECGRPGKELMHKIILAEIKKIEGNPLWSDKIVNFLFSQAIKEQLPEDYDDPRLALGLLVGRERLEDGSFLRDYCEVNSIKL